LGGHSDETGENRGTASQYVGWWIIYYNTSRLRIFYLHGDVTIAGKGLQTLGLCSALRALFLIVPHLVWHGSSGFPCLIRRTAPYITYPYVCGLTKSLLWMTDVYTRIY
jgi:hypothetical protein